MSVWQTATPGNQVFFGSLAPEEGLAKAQAATDKALALDDQLGEAYNSLASIKQERGDYEGAEAMYRRALELNPNYADGVPLTTVTY